MSEDSEKVAGMAIMSMARDIDELKAEIERLRGLLRDVDDGLDDYWVTTKEGVDWVCRRSKALGE